MTPAEHAQAASRLDEAKRTRKQIRMISLAHPEMTLADAYAIQRAWREIEETGLAAGVLGHPATGVVWLAARLAENGERLEAGEIVLAGSFVRPIEVGRGDSIVADYGPQGIVRINFD